jgi:nodulation protein S (NodS)
MTWHTDTDYLDRLYAADPDNPWRLSGSYYERRTREIVLAVLNKPRFETAFEPARSSGELTKELAERCESLLASGYHPRAVGEARRRLSPLANVTVESMLLPEQWPTGRRFDLIVLSEFGYYLAPAAWHTICEQAAAGLSEGGTVVACHWRADFAERRSQTARLHAALDRTLGACRYIRVSDRDFLLDAWTRNGSR